MGEISTFPIHLSRKFVSTPSFSLNSRLSSLYQHSSHYYSFKMYTSTASTTNLYHVSMAFPSEPSDTSVSGSESEIPFLPGVPPTIRSGTSIATSMYNCPVSVVPSERLGARLLSKSEAATEVEWRPASEGDETPVPSVICNGAPQPLLDSFQLLQSQHAQHPPTHTTSSNATANPDNTQSPVSSAETEDTEEDNAVEVFFDAVTKQVEAAASELEFELLMTAWEAPPPVESVDMGERIQRPKRPLEEESLEETLEALSLNDDDEDGLPVTHRSKRLKRELGRRKRKLQYVFDRCFAPSMSEILLLSTPNMGLNAWTPREAHQRYLAETVDPWVTNQVELLESGESYFESSFLQLLQYQMILWLRRKDVGVGITAETMNAWLLEDWGEFLASNIPKPASRVLFDAILERRRRSLRIY